MSMPLVAGFGTAVITPPTPVQLAGFIDDQPATEVHDDLEVRAWFVRGEHGAVCLLVCDLLGMSPSFANPVRDAVGAALGLTRGAVLTSCIHTHAGPSTISGGHLLGWVTPDGYRELLVDACVTAARAAEAAAVPASLRAGRWPLPDGLSLQPPRPAVRADVLGGRRARGRRRRASARRQRLDPSGRARAGMPRGVERLGRPVPRRARTAGRRHDGDALGRDRRRESVPRPPPGQRLLRRRVRGGRTAGSRRRRGGRRGAELDGTGRSRRSGGRARACRRRHVGIDNAHRRT